MVAKDLDFKHLCCCYVLCVNILSAGSVAAIDGKLRSNEAYLGYAPCTYASLAKTFSLPTARGPQLRERI